MRPEHAAQQIMRGADIGHPVAHGFVDGVLQSARAGIHAAHFGAEQPHAEDVKLLAAHVLGAHVDNTLETEERCDRGRCHAMLPGAGFRDDAMLAHALDQQRLPKTVVDLVRAGVQQVFALEINLRPAKLLGKPAGKE